MYSDTICSATGRASSSLYKKLCVLVCGWWWFDWSFARLTASAVTITSIILSSNKIHNGDILVLAYPDCPGKWPLNKCLVLLEMVMEFKVIKMKKRKFELWIEVRKLSEDEIWERVHKFDVSWGWGERQGRFSTNGHWEFIKGMMIGTAEKVCGRKDRRVTRNPGGGTKSLTEVNLN